MLKDMSVAVGNAYGNMLTANEFNNELIAFSGLKWELSGNLLNDFVTPVERSDIYNLASLLGEEFYYISKLSNFISLVDVNEFVFAQSLCSAFKNQTNIFSRFFVNKNNSKVLKDINEAKASLSGVNAGTVLSVKNCLKSTEQPLLKYVVLSGFFDIYKSIDITLTQVQKVIINNN